MSDSKGAPWWEAFGDANIDRLETQALANNLDIQQAEARLDQAQAMAGYADAALAPSANLEAAAGSVRQSLNSGMGILSNFLPNYQRNVDQGQVGLSASWELDFAGGLRHQREAANAGVLASSAELDALRLAISAEVADAYFVMVGAKGQKAALQHQFDLLASQLRIMKVRAQVGVASREDIERLTADVEESAAPLPLLGATISGQQNRLAVLLGRNPSEWEMNIDGINEVPLAPDPSGGVPVELLSRRPDVLAAQHRLAGANAGVAASMAEYYPRVSLSALVGQDSNNYATLSSSQSTYTQSILGLRWRLFDFGRIDAEVKAAKGKQKEALLAYRSAVLRAASDVETGFSQLMAAREQLKHLEAQGNGVRRVAESVQKSMRAGAASEDEALSAERAVARADSDIVLARREVARSIVVAARALGGPIEK
jgi:NodT family efflux transporter outer membrane factor (OMF) lipoprotein